MSELEELRRGLARRLDIASLKHHGSPVLEYALQCIADDPDYPPSDTSYVAACEAIAFIDERAKATGSRRLRSYAALLTAPQSPPQRFGDGTKEGTGE